ncbi:LytR C-terminal domain-containing protein [Candidatus Microgenomates bacterium]|nr:LytR C-terminal domain-containing protein [Candidatus Microgenomates bacterium]
MRQLNNINITANTVVVAILAIVFLAALAIFINTMVNTVVKPFWLSERQVSPPIALDSSFDEIVFYIEERRGLTANVSSATLNQEQKTSVTAEVINGSGIPLAAKTLADELTGLGISVLRTANSETEVTGSSVSLKSQVLFYKDRIAEKFGTKSAEIKFEQLDESYPFDIQIIIGK